MDIRYVQSKKILTPQKRGFLTEGEYPFTHTLSWAIGCGFGSIYCGKYCYAQKLPNWYYSRQEDEKWGDAIVIKENAPELLDKQLKNARSRTAMRIFMSSVTDPYQPIERKIRMTRRCLNVFAQYDDLDLLVIQTRGPAVVDDLDLIASIPYAWLSLSIETDRYDLPYGPSRAHIEKRLDVVRRAVKNGVQTQITVSPCLPYSDEFADKLVDSGAHRIVVDTFVLGDGSKGKRTADSPFADLATFDWQDNAIAEELYAQLVDRQANVAWSSSGFVGIPPRHHV
jgi:DNA repair photolyase